jgi:type IV pilus assembly protein PilW
MIQKEDGFSIVELLVALALTAIVMAAVYKALSSQQKVYVAQDQVVAMQQDLRALIENIVQAIRTAGYDPTSSNQFGFISLSSPGSPGFGRYTSSDGIAFYADIDNPPNGIVDSSDSEQVAFRLNVDQSGKTLAPGSRDNILRKYSTGAVRWQPLAENIEAVGFAYAIDDDRDGQLDTVAGGTIWAIDTNNPPTGMLNVNLDTNHDGEVDANDSPNGQLLARPVSIKKIRAVKIWILERSQHPDKDFLNANTYVVANQRIAASDNHRRRLVTTTVRCRNVGLLRE